MPTWREKNWQVVSPADMSVVGVAGVPHAARRTSSFHRPLLDSEPAAVHETVKATHTSNCDN